MPRPAAATTLAFAWLILSVACSDNTGSSSHGLRIIAGANLSDTVLTKLEQALVVQVVGPDGRPDSGLTVRFESQAGEQPYTLSTYVAPLEGTSFGGLAVDTTDARGRAAALVLLGPTAGPAHLTVSVPEQGLTATVDYTILPGTPVRIVAAPEDTALTVGSTVTLHAAVVDRYGNRRADPIEYTAGTADLAVDPGAVIEGHTVARSYVVARHGEWADTTLVSVVPNGTLAALRTSDQKIVLVNLDGSGLQPLAAVDGMESEAFSWNPSGSRLVYATQAGGWDMLQLRSVDLDGTSHTLISGAVPGLESATWPHYSRDGQWIYFSGRPLSTNFALWRVRSDGTGAEQIGAEGYAAGGVDWRPSPSPDGTRIAYVTASSSGAAIRVFNVGTRASSAWSVPGQTPRWSPTRQLIAFVAQYGGPLKLMNPDGANVRTISVPGHSYAEGQFSWSPDGVWLAARGPEMIELINIDTGLVLPLGFTRGMIAPAWQP